MLFADWLVRGNNRSLVSSWGHVSERFVEAALTELIRTAEEFDRIVDAEWSQEKLHGSIMLIAQWQDVAPHGASLALPAKTKPAGAGYSGENRLSGTGACRDGRLARPRLQAS